MSIRAAWHMSRISGPVADSSASMRKRAMRCPKRAISDGSNLSCISDLLCPDGIWDRLHHQRVWGRQCEDFPDHVSWTVHAAEMHSSQVFAKDAQGEQLRAREDGDDRGEECEPWHRRRMNKIVS